MLQFTLMLARHHSEFENSRIVQQCERFGDGGGGGGAGCERKLN